jgi:hypothetical protein
MYERNKKLKKEFAIFDKAVSSNDKYRVTTPSKLVFNTRKLANEYRLKKKIKNSKIFVVYGYGR